MDKMFNFVAVGFGLIAILLLGNSVFIVDEPKQAIVLQLGEVVRDVKDSGLYLKIPFIQKVVYFELGLRLEQFPLQMNFHNQNERHLL